ncbi:hypothetical protein ACFSE0_10490 [Ochrobactrum teleogrylli]|uniref:Uncharacterized protein n=1 Tax=Ochrobactrum teleogrylli TaxID=2479765 RepID=A0ABY2Y7M2_9HYPH|nr:hypothetical protein [[Ochrobactrum] teleogrylli]TNV17724.1 hypothetical protein FIC94_05990 [[Ochrobactrum] teleogrylli]
MTASRYGTSPNAFAVEVSPEMATAIHQGVWEAIAGQWSLPRLKETLAARRVPGFADLTLRDREILTRTELEFLGRKPS